MRGRGGGRVAAAGVQPPLREREGFWLGCLESPAPRLGDSALSDLPLAGERRAGDGLLSGAGRLMPPRAPAHAHGSHEHLAQKPRLAEPRCKKRAGWSHHSPPNGGSSVSHRGGVAARPDNEIFGGLPRNVRACFLHPGEPARDMQPTCHLGGHGALTMAKDRQGAQREAPPSACFSSVRTPGFAGVVDPRSSCAASKRACRGAA